MSAIKILGLLKSKLGILLIVSFFLSLTFLVFAISLINNPTINTLPQEITQITQGGSPIGNYPSILSLEPSELKTITAGSIQNFKITFKSPVVTNQISSSLTRKNYTTDQATSPVGIKTTYNYDTTTLTISPNEPIQPFSEYALTITNKNNIILLAAKFSSRDVPPTPPTNNNPKLKQYLPHETTSYKLSLNALREVYVFNFKITPGSTTSLSTQYQNAKREAEEFIKSKSIDLNSIIVEWRHS